MTVLYNLAKMTTATTGTGTITLGSAVTGYLSFATAGVQDGEVVAYAIRDGANSESGYGTYTSAGTTLTRTVTTSTNSNNAINLSGSAEIAITPRKEDIVNKTGDTMTGALTVLNSSGLKILDTDASHTLGLIAGSNLTANRTLTVTTGDASRTITLGGDLTTSGAYNVTLTLTATSNLTMPAGTKTLAALEDGNTFTTSQSIQGGLTLTSSTAYNPQLNITHDSNTAGSAGYYLLNRARSGMTDVQASDALGTIGASGYFNGAIRLAGYFSWSVDGAPSGSTVYTKLVYATVSAGNVFAIDKDGKVGVKTTSPTTELEVVGTAKATTLNLTNALDVAYGGTGATSLTANYALLGNGTSALQAVAPGASGNVFTSNGTTWTSAAPTASGGKAADQQTFTSTGTWTKPSSFGAKSYVLIQCWGAGGGGGRHATAAQAGGGGGGAYKERWILLSSLGATETVTIGAGGTGRITSNGDGTAGGNTTFGSFVTAYGGGGGGNGGASIVGIGGNNLSAGATAANTVSPYYPSTLARFWFSAYDGTSAWNNFDQPIANPYAGAAGRASSPSLLGSGAAIWGGAGGGAGATNTTGGTSEFGGAGGTGGASPTAGTQPGGGGGAGANVNAKDGGAGYCVVTVFDGA